MSKSVESKRLHDDTVNRDAYVYEKPSVTVDVAVCTVFNNSLQVLLVKRRNAPFENFWAIPGRFVSIERRESLEEAAKRTLKQATGIEEVFLEQLKTYGDPLRDPRMRVITVAYYALVPYSKVASIDSDKLASKNASWVPLCELPQELAFDHGAILQDLLARLRGKISYTPIAFSLVDQRFTWAELQQVYEIILGNTLLTPNFRRKLLSMYHITEPGGKKKTRGRPSTYLSFEGEKEF